MSELLAYAQLGFWHIVSPNAADHILFLLALAAIYRGRDWRAALWVMSAFTVGHSMTLALAVTHTLVLPAAVVEFLIPVTIAVSGVENLVRATRRRASAGDRYRPALAAFFGLIHGAGFAGYLESLFVTDVARPLLGFNVGIEVGQGVVLAGAAVVFWVMDAALRGVPNAVRPWEPFRVRMVGVSAVVACVALVWAAERVPA